MGLLNKILGNYTNTASDPVCFQTIVGGRLGPETRNVCYAGHVAHGKHSGIIGKDAAGSSLLSEDHYYEWMALCKQHGLVINESLCFREDNRNQIYIEEGPYHYALIYTTLCCFRWSTHYTRMVYDIISDKNNISFHQKLHYQLARVISNWNHSFTYLSPGRNAYTIGSSDQASNLDLRSSIAWKIYFNDFDDKERSKHFSEVRYNHINEALVHVTKTLPSMKIKDLKDVLHPCWTPLYEMPWADKKNYSEAFAECKKTML